MRTFNPVIHSRDQLSKERKKNSHMITLFDAKSFFYQQWQLLDAEQNQMFLAGYQYTFDKTIKSYIIKPTEDLRNGKECSITFDSSRSQLSQINASKVTLQLSLMEKLRLKMKFLCKDQLYLLTICPKSVGIEKSSDSVTISSSFILMKKWISLSFDIPSFFDELKSPSNMNNILLDSLIINSSCKIRNIQESPCQMNGDGSFLSQRISQKRINELLQLQNKPKTQNESRGATIFQRQTRRNNTTTYERSLSKESQKLNNLPQIQGRKNSQEHTQTSFKSETNIKGSSRASFRTKNQETPSTCVSKVIPVDPLVQKNLKLVTGLQVIEEVQQKPRIKPRAIMAPQMTQEIRKIPVNSDEFKKKAVRSFLRHSDLTSPSNKNIKNQDYQKHQFQPKSTEDQSKIECSDRLNSSILGQDSLHNEFYNEVQGMDTATQFFNENQNSKRSQPSNRKNKDGSDKKESETMNLYFNHQGQDIEASYQSKVWKFSSTFQKPLGFSSLNFKLASQNSNTFTQLQQHTTQDYFYLSSQQFNGKIEKVVQENGEEFQVSQSKISQAQMEAQIEEKIDQDEKDEFRSKSSFSMGNSNPKKQIKSESSDDIVVSQFM